MHARTTTRTRARARRPRTHTHTHTSTSTSTSTQTHTPDEDLPNTQAQIAAAAASLPPSGTTLLHSVSHPPCLFSVAPAPSLCRLILPPPAAYLPGLQAAASPAPSLPCSLPRPLPNNILADSQQKAHGRAIVAGGRGPDAAASEKRRLVCVANYRKCGQQGRLLSAIRPRPSLLARASTWRDSCRRACPDLMARALVGGRWVLVLPFAVMAAVILLIRDMRTVLPL